MAQNRRGHSANGRVGAAWAKPRRVAARAASPVAASPPCQWANTTPRRSTPRRKAVRAARAAAGSFKDGKPVYRPGGGLLRAMIRPPPAPPPGLTTVSFADPHRIVQAHVVHMRRENVIRTGP